MHRIRPQALSVAAILLLFASPVFAQGGPPAMPVSVATPLAKRVTQWDEYSGRFEAVETVEVRPRVTGFIDKVHFTDGQIVYKDGLLFTIEQRQFQLAVDAAKADVTRIQAQVELAATEVERARPLVKSGAVTERDFDQRRANLSVTLAQLQAAETAVKQAELNLEWTEVRAPISGRISNRKVDPGNLVIGGSSGATLLTTIVSLDPIHFVFDASEADYLRYTRLMQNRVRPGSGEAQSPVRIRLADERDFGHKGTLNFLDNQLNPRSGTIRGRAVLENKAGLLTPGVFGRLQLYGGDIDALLIPDSAVISDQARKIVFTVGQDNVVKARPVELGGIVEGLRVVRSGLGAQDKVVIDGLANPMVRPGATIVPQAAEIKAASN